MGKAVGKSRHTPRNNGHSRDAEQEKHTNNTAPSEQDSPKEGSSREDKPGEQCNTTPSSLQKWPGLTFSAGSPQNVFLLIGLIFGLIFICLIPPLLAPDEWTHFQRAYYTSEGNMRAELHFNPKLGRNLTGGMLPRRFEIFQKMVTLDVPYNETNIRLLPMLVKYNADKYLAQRKFHKENILSFFDQPPDADNERIFSSIFPTTAMYSPHLYFPQAAGIALGRQMGLPIIALMYIGRAFNLFVWFCLIYLAIRTTPAGKWLFMLLSLTPSSLFQASSLSADALTNGLSLLLVACFLRYAYDEGGGKARLTGIFLLVLLVAVSKMYFQFIFLYLLIPVERIGNRKKYWAGFVFLGTLTAIAVLLWHSYAKDLNVQLAVYLSPVDQLRHVLQYPGRYITAIWNTVARDGAFLISSFIGKLGHYDHYLPDWLVVVHVLVLFFVASTDSSERLFISFRDKIILCAVFLLSSLWVFTSQYLVWTKVGADFIEGVQGRYFIPFMPLFFLLFYNRRFDMSRYMRKIHWLITCYIVVVLTVSSSLILTEYYH